MKRFSTTSSVYSPAPHIEWKMRIKDDCLFFREAFFTEHISFVLYHSREKCVKNSNTLRQPSYYKVPIPHFSIEHIIFTFFSSFYYAISRSVKPKRALEPEYSVN